MGTGSGGAKQAGILQRYVAYNAYSHGLDQKLPHRELERRPTFDEQLMPRQGLYRSPKGQQHLLVGTLLLSLPAPATTTATTLLLIVPSCNQHNQSHHSSANEGMSHNHRWHDRHTFVFRVQQAPTISHPVPLLGPPSPSHPLFLVTKNIDRACTIPALAFEQARLMVKVVPPLPSWAHMQPNPLNFLPP
jgi:hypothetical protein